MSEDPSFETVVALLDDEYARAILRATSVEPMTASQLADRCDISQSTVYRRVERLTDAGLVAERTRPRSDGHHDTVYAATLDRFEVRLHEGELDATVERESADLADGLTKLWENL